VTLILPSASRAKVRVAVRRLAQIEESVARYLSRLDTADLQEPSEALAAKTRSHGVSYRRVHPDEER
jgi:hypothetical protein